MSRYIHLIEGFTFGVQHTAADGLPFLDPDLHQVIGFTDSHWIIYHGVPLGFGSQSELTRR